LSFHYISLFLWHFTKKKKGRQADEFYFLEAKWTDHISISALQALASQKNNKGDMLPINEDILKL
jgi:hypothetical protein